MTEYAIDDRGRLIAIWRGSRGNEAATVAELPARAETETEGGRHVAGMLTDLSHAAWAAYTLPTKPDRAEPGPAGEKDQVTAARLLDVMRDPGTPRFQDGRLLIADGNVENHAHWVGWCLRSIKDSSLTDAVLREARIELDAVERAGKGDLTGRAQQAVHLDRTTVSAIQVALADQLLSDDPLGGFQMFATLDPAASAVAAAHWLDCAASVLADECGIDVDQAVVEASRIEPVPHEVPTLVLTRLGSGRRPEDVVLGLIRDTLLVRKGRLPSLARLQRQVADRLTVLEQHSDCHPSVALALTELRVTPLDPACPARSLLAHLLEGLRACATLYVHHFGGEDADKAEPDTGPDPDAEPEAEPGLSEQESLMDDWADATRTEVRRTRYRLF